MARLVEYIVPGMKCSCSPYTGPDKRKPCASEACIFRNCLCKPPSDYYVRLFKLLGYKGFLHSCPSLKCNHGGQTEVI